MLEVAHSPQAVLESAGGPGSIPAAVDTPEDIQLDRTDTFNRHREGWLCLLRGGR